MAEKTTPAEWQARTRYREILAAVDHLDDSGADYAVKLLGELQDFVDREFGRSDWENYRARQLTDAVRGATDDFRERYWGEAQGWQRQAFDLGLTPFKEMSLNLNWAGIQRQGFEFYSQNGLHFITDLADDLRKSLSREVLLTTTGLQAPNTAMQHVRDLLGGGKKAAARAQAIVRTEVGRNFSLATLLSLEDSVQVLGAELLKMWLHAPLGSSKYARPAHVAMHAKTAPVDGYFYFPGGPLRCPQDPQGSASETIHCKCRIVAYREDWGDLGGLLGDVNRR